MISRPATGCGGGARILDFRGMNPALYYLSCTAIKQKAARIAPERLLLFGSGALHPDGLSSTSLACPGAA